MTKQEVLELLKSLNPKARADDIAIYADAFLAYSEASENITKNGNIVAHPRTGAPMENPYIKVRTQAGNVIRKYRLKVGKLWD